MDKEAKHLIRVFRFVVISKRVDCKGKKVDTKYIFKRGIHGFNFGFISFSEDEMVRIIQDALKQGFSVIYTNQKERV